MMYFEVYELKARELIATRVNSDGTPDYDTEHKIDTDAVIEYVVYEYGEDGGHEGTKHYQVSEYYDEQDCIEKIKEDYPAGEWQNNNW